MAAGYQSIPSSGNNNAETNSIGKKLAIFIAAVVIFLVGYFSGGFKTTSISSAPSTQEDEASHWPDYLVSQAALFTKRPTTTVEAVELGWEKSDESCAPSLGEPWLFKGERGLNTSVTLYFTPQVGDVAGVISAIEVDYYGYIEENLVGTYFSEERTSKDGSYHSVAVALRNANQQDLCDTEKPASKQFGRYLAINPDLVNKEIPVHSGLSELEAEWREGSCIPQMGYHWATDVNGGKDLAYKADSIVPIQPMYRSADGSIAGIFFMATVKKQNWAADCNVFVPTPECMGPLNFWDPGPGLNQVNAPPFYFCSNFCGECKFTGSGSDPGIYTTMHWFFTDTSLEACAPSDMGPRPYCRSGEYPTLD